MSFAKKGTFALAVLVFVIGAWVLIVDSAKLKVFGIAWLVLALAGVTVCAIKMATHHKELPDATFEIFSKMYLTAGFFVLALGWVLR
jgi:hypothetical protein